jgi:hypothetical protein
MAYKALPMETVGLDDLALDLVNYRVPVEQESQDAALNYLYASEDVYETARMIIRDGYFDNEVPIVAREGDVLTVLEGNRRVTALKVLQDPTLIPAHEAEIRALLKRYETEAEDLPTRIRVIVAPSRNAARFHIARLHTTTPKRKWTLDQQSTYYFSLLGPTMTVEDIRSAYPGINVPRFIRMAVMRRFLKGVKFHDRTLRYYVTSQDLAMSAFEYAYKNPDIAAAIGVSFAKDGQLLPAGKDPEKLGASLKGQQLVGLEYLMTQFRDGSLNTRAEALRKDTSAHAALVATLTGVPPPTGFPADDDAEDDVDLDDPDDLDLDDHDLDTNDAGSEGHDGGDGSSSGGGSAGGAAGGVGGPRGPNHPDTKDRLVLSGLDYTTHVPVNLHNRYQELRKLSLKDTPVASAMLMRAVLESTVKSHFEGTATPATGELKRCMAVVKQVHGRDRTIATAVDKIYSSNARTPGSVSWFNDIAHSADAVPTPDTVRQAWSLILPVLRRLLRPA